MNILILGGGICGLGTSLLLARDGHEVTVLEADPEPPPTSAEEACERWARKGVPQFRQPHNFMPGLRLLLDRELPEIEPAFRRAGAGRFDLLNPLPPTFADRAARPIDEQLWTYTARRPVAEWVFGGVAAREPRLTIRRGVRVGSLLAGPSAIAGVPHVTGVRTVDGESLAADLVVDASGRGSRSPAWLAALGARPPLEVQADSGFAYYTRFFRGAEPQRRGGTLMPIGTISLLTLPGDNDTWSVTVFCASGDQPLKNLRREETWARVVRACPLHAHWLDGEPITEILSMSGVVDRYRRFVVDGVPVATGFAAVADAWACTNPSAGRGLTVGFLHAARLRDALRESNGEPASFAERFDAKTEEEIKPWYDAQVAVDRPRFAEMEALRNGLPPPDVADPLAKNIRAFMGSIAADPDLFRAGLEYIGTITPVQQILQRPAVAAAIRAVREATKDAPPPRIPGPDRAQLLELLK